MRRLCIIDKSTLTILLGIDYVFLFSYIIKKGSRYIFIAIIILAFLIWENVFIIQSKTTLFGLAVVATSSIFIRKINILNLIKNNFKYILLLCLILPFLPIKWEMPEALQQGINKITGEQVYSLRANIKDETYETRNTVLMKTWAVLNENPLCGSGFGNIKKALTSTHTGLSQGESQIIDMALEGGYTYIFAFGILTLPILFQSAFKRRKNRCLKDFFLECMMIMFIIQCIGNEVLSTNGWFLLGSMSYLYCKKAPFNLIQ